MLFKEMMEKERSDGWKAGLREGRQATQRENILELLGLYGDVPEDITDRVNQETDPEVLKRWHMAAARAASFEDFREKM